MENYVEANYVVTHDLNGNIVRIESDNPNEEVPYDAIRAGLNMNMREEDHYWSPDGRVETHAQAGRNPFEGQRREAERRRREEERRRELAERRREAEYQRRRNEEYRRRLNEQRRHEAESQRRYEAQYQWRREQEYRRHWEEEYRRQRDQAEYWQRMQRPLNPRNGALVLYDGYDSDASFSYSVD